MRKSPIYRSKVLFNEKAVANIASFTPTYFTTSMHVDDNENEKLLKLTNQFEIKPHFG